MGVNRGDNRDIVASLLGDLLTIVVSISLVSITRLGLADSDHLYITHLLECHLHSLGSCSLSLRLVGVATDFIVNLLSTLSTDSSCHSVTLLHILDTLTGQLNGVTASFKVGSTNLSSFIHIKHRTVVLGLFVSMVDNCMVSHSMMSNSMVCNMMSSPMTGDMMSSMVD